MIVPADGATIEIGIVLLPALKVMEFNAIYERGCMINIIKIVNIFFCKRLLKASGMNLW